MAMKKIKPKYGKVIPPAVEVRRRRIRGFGR